MTRRKNPIPFTVGCNNVHRHAPRAIALALMLASFVVPGQVATAGPGVQPREYRLRLYHTHTGERIDIVYRLGNEYVPSAIAKLDYFLRDHRTGEVHAYDPKVFDILEQLTEAVGRPDGEIDIICGYRTPWSNQYLRTHSQGVAKNSLHMQAQAIDIRMPGIETSRLREIALSLHEGGVGYYPHSNFVHVDTGRVRQWCFECSARQLAAN